MSLLFDIIHLRVQLEYSLAGTLLWSLPSGFTNAALFVIATFTIGIELIGTEIPLDGFNTLLDLALF